jgi:hypothetical protein
MKSGIHQKINRKIKPSKRQMKKTFNTFKIKIMKISYMVPSIFNWDLPANKNIKELI